MKMAQSVIATLLLVGMLAFGVVSVLGNVSQQLDQITNTR